MIPTANTNEVHIFSNERAGGVERAVKLLYNSKNNKERMIPAARIKTIAPG
jgi:hypothetical protein